MIIEATIPHPPRIPSTIYLSLSLTTHLAANYTLSMDEPHEIEHVLLFFLNHPDFEEIRRRTKCARTDVKCLLETMCHNEVPNGISGAPFLLLFL